MSLSNTEPVVLIAEDDEIGRLVVKHLLDQLGIKSFTVVNGREALEAVEQERPDLVLMDIRMPVMDGLEAIRRIRGLLDEERSKVPIIVVTAHVLAGDDVSFLEAGADGFLRKPLSLAELREAISRFIPAGAQHRQTG
ncbi:MAG: response regulator [Spirochaetaceae bacterium]